MISKVILLEAKFLFILILLSFSTCAFSTSGYSYQNDSSRVKGGVRDTIPLSKTEDETTIGNVDSLLLSADKEKKARNFTVVIQNYKEALELSLLKNDTSSVAMIHFLLGTTHLELKNYTSAIGELEECLLYSNKIDNPKLFADASFSLGSIYSDFKNFELAITYYGKALEQFKALDSAKAVGAVLDSLGGVYLAGNDIEQALKNYLASLELRKESDSTKHLAELLIKIGDIYLSKKDNESSLHYFKEAQRLGTPANSSQNARINNKIGSAFYNLGNYYNAEHHFRKARDIAESTSNKEVLANAYKNLAEVNEKLNHRSQEIKYFRKYIGLQDSLLAVENKKRIDELRAEFEMKNKQKAIEILEHQKALLSSQAEMKDISAQSNRNLLIFFACLIVLSILLLGMLIRRHNAKKVTNLTLQNHLADVRQQKNQIELQRDIIEQSNIKLEQARKIIIKKNRLLEENNLLLEKTINERTLELYKAYQKLSFHVDNTSLAVMEFNNQLELIRWSDQAEKIFGWKTEEVIGKRFHEIGFVLEKDIDSVLKAVHDLLYGDTPSIFFQSVNCNSQGEKLYVEWNTSVLLNEDGSVDSIMAIANDVTSREEAFVALQASHRELDNFIYKASHDLRGPLARIQGVVNLGLMEAKEKVSREYFSMLHTTGNQLNNILSRLLMIYDINHHSIKLDEIVLKDKIIEIIEDLKEANDHVNIRVKLLIEDSLKWKTDLVLFQIIIKNMFDNALFFRNKKDIKVIFEAGKLFEGKLYIKITDNGLGIPDSVREKAFDMFFHGAAKTGGTGLGLYMSKKTIERLGGTIELLDGSAKNTVFRIILPVITSSEEISSDFFDKKLISN